MDDFPLELPQLRCRLEKEGSGASGSSGGDAEDFFTALPKAELHLHLEGSVEPETLRELAPETPWETIRQMYEFTDFPGFLRTFGWVVKRLRTPEDYALITRRLLERLAAQNVRYVEITVAAGVVLWKEQEFGPLFDGIREGARGSSVETHWILDGVRQFGAEHVMKVARLAAERVEQGVIAFGIGGDEQGGPAGWFTEAYRFAKDSGLRLTAHAGENAGPESVWAALALGAERIGHGIAAIADPALVDHLRDHNIPLEVCVTSNLVTGVVPRIEEHPLRRLFDAGVPIVLNSDDPGMFGAWLADEYRLASRAFGFTETELRALAANAFRYGFRSGAGA